MRLDQKLRLPRSPVFWLLAALLAYAPYAQGLFFERDFLYAQFFVGIVVLVAAFLQGTALSFFKSKQDFISVGLFLAYSLADLSAVHAKSAIIETLKLLTCLTVYWLTAYGGWGERDFIRLIKVLFWSSVGVALLGIAAALGAIDLAGAYVDNRIYSTFQYPNTLAAYLGAMTILGVYLRWESQSLLKLLYLPALYLTVLCLVSTGSRGGIGFLLITLPALYLFLPKESRAGIMKILIESVLIGFLGALAFLKYVAAGNVAAGWAVVLVGLIIAVLLETQLNYLDKLRLRSLLAGFILVVIIAGVAYGAVQGNPLARIKTSSLQLHEFQERLTYYRDGLSMTISRPIQGYGGGGWSMYPRYQGYPYWVSDPHNNLVKVAIESGSIGALFYLGWWIGLGSIAWQKRKRGEVLSPILFSSILLLGLHSLIDFDMSYTYISLLVWTCGGVIIAQELMRREVRSLVPKYPGRITACLVAAIMTVSTVAFLLAAEDGGYANVYTEQGNTQAALASLSLARSKDPFNASYPYSQAEILLNSPGEGNLEKASQAINKALTLDSTDQQIKNLAAQIYLVKGNLDRAQALAEDQLSFQTFDPEAYLALANLYDSLADKAREQGKVQDAERYLSLGAQLAQRFQDRLNRMSARDTSLWVAGKPPIPVELTQKCAELAAKIKNL